jgi:hypothetical protein
MAAISLQVPWCNDRMRRGRRIYFAAGTLGVTACSVLPAGVPVRALDGYLKRLVQKTTA